jgi:hypothetical protein
MVGTEAGHRRRDKPRSEDGGRTHADGLIRSAGQPGEFFAVNLSPNGPSARQERLARCRQQDAAAAPLDQNSVEMLFQRT